MGNTANTDRQNNFNSIKVQLKHDRGGKRYFAVTNFNSIKVQLKRTQPQFVVAPSTFQFHKGTIKARS